MVSSLRRSLELPEPPWIVGHRGAAAAAPENTLTSVRQAVAEAADLVELDLQLTADGVLVAVHDWDLTRLAGCPDVVEETPWRRLDGIRLDRLPAGDTEGIPTLDRILESFRDVPLNLELKRRRADPERFARSLVRGLGRRPRVLVSSFDWPLLGAVRAAAPDLPLAPLASRSSSGLFAVARDLAAVAVHCHRRLARAPLLRRAADARLPVLVYTVNDPGRARRLLARGVAGLFTDRPGALRRELAGAASC